MKFKILLTFFLFLLITSCETQKKELSASRKKELKAQFFHPDFVMRDTIIGYQLYPDSLVLNFEQHSHYKDWAVQIILRDPRIDTSGIDLGDFDPKLVVNNKMVFRDLHISPDSVNIYVPELFACPHYDSGILVYRINDGGVFNSRRFYKKQGDKNILTPWGPDKKVTYVSFNLKMLKNLNRGEYDYCYKILYKESGLSSNDYNELVN